ncbi:c-type cytochrome [Tropicibacter oceani]|uniref:C-type cytochrome n=1 Tax=Tropicibacter oceani TaxID=3058420 RepID=A0ABY8QIH4_9RHOB|nr:c-type cytochrome [Tropicibacter oceani]WGW03811.1 c-type cytochrome [Tropicibacter oceani]
MSKSLKLFGGTALGLLVMGTAAYNFADRNVVPIPKDLPTLAALPAPIPEPEAPVQAAAAAPAAEAAVETAEAAAEPAAAEGLLISAAHADEASTGMRFGLGREAMPEEVAAWNLDVSPDGTGLPEGSGNAADGEPIFEENCAVCHGSFAEGVDNWPKLAGGNGTLAREDPLKTVGSYWPYLSTVWDYVNRSMPFGNAQSLSSDEVYAIVAYILYSNDMIEDDFELSKETWAEVEMLNADGFIIDDRAESEYAIWSGEPCMENCKDEVKITMRATVLDVTPDEAGSDEAAAEAPAEETQVAAAPAEEAAPAAEEPVAEETAAEAPAAEAPAETAVAALDADLVAKGENVFKKCKACHQVGDGAKHRTGPELNGIYGRAIGGAEGFKYSKTMAEMGGVWNEETLHAFLADPRGYVKGTKMSFAGLKSDEDLDAITEFLKSVSQ